MDRKESLKTMLLGSLSLPFLTGEGKSSEKDRDSLIHDAGDAHRQISYESPWHRLPDMTWTGAAYWANRLQDWRIKNGKLECIYRGQNRSLSCLTHQLESSRNSFRTRVLVQCNENLPASTDNRAGIRLGAKGEYEDYRSAALFGEGLDVGLNTKGELFIGELKKSAYSIAADKQNEELELEIIGRPRGMNYSLEVFLRDGEGETLLTVSHQSVSKEWLRGNMALFSDMREVETSRRGSSSVTFDHWVMEGQKFDFNADHIYGPIYFAQYTQDNGHLQLTAQLAPLALPRKAYLEIKQNGEWNSIAEADVEYPSYTAQFKVSDWDPTRQVPYRVKTELPLNDGGAQTYTWRGTVAAEPGEKNRIKALVCSCNFEYGFPDQEVVDNAGQHQADLVMFLGDQFYEPMGGFGIQRDPAEKAYLDYLRKWYQFGWSYRELFRHRPCICLPDDHDVYHGNLFGSGGDKVPDKPGPFDRDWGGYLMPADWVNMVMTTQASHMPDPYDPEPINQGIHVFYTDWKYGGISFGIVEDRKFKSGPKEILPETIEERDGFVTTEDYDISEHDFEEATLLGERQIDFLEQWVEDWSQQTEFKVLVSATTFHSLQTLPDGNASNGNQRQLTIPLPGEYIEGDEKVSDMDSNAWPQAERNRILKILRKGFAVHLNGDQHLASITKYGIDDFRDAGYQFTVPALGNSWPRRWWPVVDDDHEPIEGEPDYTGEFYDAFGHPMYVMAVANPTKTDLEPSMLYDRAPGYGIVTFDKEERTVTMECWPRHVDPSLEPGKQYRGWPRTVEQIDNYRPANALQLPTFELSSGQRPVMRIYNEKSGELDHALRIHNNTYQPVVRTSGSHRVELENEEQGWQMVYTDLQAFRDNKRMIEVEKKKD